MRKLTLAAGLVALTASVTVMAQDGTGRRLSAMLEGEAQVGAMGDPDGTGSAYVRINPGTGQLCYRLSVTGIAPATLAHIHDGEAGTNGPVVVDFMAPSSGSSSGCVTVDRSLARNIIRDPGGYYVNVHNAEYPGGALRGQLGK